MISIETIKAICEQSDMWELNNPRVIGMTNNMIKCIENEESYTQDQKETAINVILSNLIIFGKYKIDASAWSINELLLLFTIQSQPTNNPGGISMPIGFARSEEKEETWIENLVKHILSCKDVQCARCLDAVVHQYWTYID